MNEVKHTNTNWRMYLSKYSLSFDKMIFKRLEDKVITLEIALDDFCRNNSIPKGMLNEMDFRTWLISLGWNV